MAVVGDNRGGTDQPVAQRPDGSWSFEDARKRRQERQGAQTTPAPPKAGEPEEDLSALALSLADNLTIDGTPLSQLQARQELDGSDALGLPAGHAPTAEEIIHALETEQHAAAATNNGSRPGSENPVRAHSPRQPSTRRGRHGRRLHGAPRWVIACIVSAGVVTALVVQLGSGAGTTAPGHPGRTLTSGTPAPTASLSAATARFLAMEHAADRTLSPPPPRSSHAPRPRRPHARQTLLPVSTRSPSGSPTSSTITSSTSGTSEAIDTTAADQRTELQPALDLNVVGIRSSIPSDPAAHLAQLELGVELRQPIQSHPPLTRHRSRYLRLPVARARPTSTGR